MKLRRRMNGDSDGVLGVIFGFIVTMLTSFGCCILGVAILVLIYQFYALLTRAQ